MRLFQSWFSAYYNLIYKSFQHWSIINFRGQTKLVRYIKKPRQLTGLWQKNKIYLVIPSSSITCFFNVTLSAFPVANTGKLS